MRATKTQYSSKAQASPPFRTDFRSKADSQKSNKYQRYMSGQTVKDNKMFRTLGQKEEQVGFSRQQQEKYQPKILKSPMQDSRLSRERSPPQRLSSSNHSYLAARNTESQERQRSKERAYRANQEIDFYPRERSTSKPKYSDLPSHETSTQNLYSKSLASQQRSQYQSQNQYLGLKGQGTTASTSINQASKYQKGTHQLSLYDENLIAQSHQQSLDYGGNRRMESEPAIVNSQSDEPDQRLADFARSSQKPLGPDIEGVAVNLQQKMYGIENKYLALVDYYKRQQSTPLNKRLEIDTNQETQLIDGLLKEKNQFKQELENLASCANTVQFSQEDTRMQETLKLFQKENEDLKQMLNNTMGATSPNTLNLQNIFKSTSTLQGPLQISSENIKQSVFEELRGFEQAFLKYINAHYNTFTERDVTEMLNDLAEKLITRIESLQLSLYSKQSTNLDSDSIEQNLQDFARDLEQLELQNGYNQQNLKKHLFSLKNKHDTVKLDLKRALRQVDALSNQTLGQRRGTGLAEYDSIENSSENRRMRAFASDEKRSSLYYNQNQSQIDSVSKEEKENLIFGVQSTVRDIQDRLRECETDFQQISDGSQAFSQSIEGVKDNYNKVVNEIQVQLVIQRGGTRHEVFTPTKQNQQNTYLLEDQVRSLKEHNMLLQDQLQKAEQRAQRFEQSPTRRDPLISLDQQKRSSSVDPAEAYFDKKALKENSELHQRIQDLNTLLREKDFQIDNLSLKLRTQSSSKDNPSNQAQSLENLLDYTQGLNHQNQEMLVNMIRLATRFLNAMKRLQKAVHRKESDVRGEKTEFEATKKELEKRIKEYRAQVELNEAQRPLKERSLASGTIQQTQFGKFQKHAAGSNTSHQIRRDLYSKLSAQSQSIDPSVLPHEQQNQGQTPQKREKSPISLRTLHLSKTIEMQDNNVFRSIEANPTNAFSVEKQKEQQSELKQVKQELTNLTEDNNQLQQEVQDKDDYIASLKLDLQHQKTVNEREKQKYENVKQNLKEAIKEKQELILQLEGQDQISVSNRDSNQLQLQRQIDTLKKQNKELEKKNQQLGQNVKTPFDLQPLSQELKMKVQEAQREIEEQVQQLEDQLAAKGDQLQKTKKSLEKKIKDKEAKFQIQKNQELQQLQGQLQQAQKDYQAKLAQEQEDQKRSQILQNSLQKLQTDIKLKEQNIQQLQQQLKQTQEQEQKVQQDIQTLQKQHYQQLQKQKEETREKERQKKEIQDQLQSLRTDQEATQSSLHSQRQDKLQDLQDQLDKTTKDLQISQQKLQQTEQDLEQAIQDNQELQEELKEIETQSTKSQQVQNLQFVINSLQQEKQAMIAKIQSLHQQQQQSQQNIHSLQHQIQREQQQTNKEKQEQEQKLVLLQQRLSDLQLQEQERSRKGSQEQQESQRELRQAQIDLQGSKETIERLQIQLNDLFTGQQKSQIELNQQIEQIAKEKQETQKLYQLLQEDQKTLQQQQQNLQNQVQEKQERIQKQKAEIKDLQKEVKSKKSEIQKLQQDLAQSVGQNQGQIQQYEQALNQTRESLRQSEQQIQYLQQQSQQSEKLIEKQEEDLEIKDSQLTALQKEIERITAEKEEKETGLVSSQRMKETELNQQIEQRQAQVEEMMEEKSREEKRLQKQIKDLESQRNKIEQELEQAISDNQELQEELREQEQKYKNQLDLYQKQEKQRTNQLEQHIQEIEQQLGQLNIEKRNLELLNKDQETKISHLQQESLQTKTEQEKAQQERLQEREKQLQEQIQASQREILEHKKQNNEMQSQYQALVQEFNDLATEKNELLQSYEEAQKNNKVLRQSLEKGKEMIEILQERLKTVLEKEQDTQEVDTLRRELKEKEEELGLKKEELEENEAMMERVNEAIEEHNKENHELKAKCKFLMGVYKKEIEEQEGSVSEYQEGEEVNLLEFFELMQDVIEQYRMQKEEKIIMLEGMVEKGKAEMENYKKELENNNQKMKEMQGQLETVLQGIDSNDQDVRQKLEVAQRKIQNYKDKLIEKTTQYQELEEKHKKARQALERPLSSPRNNNLEKENLQLIQKLQQAEQQIQQIRNQEQSIVSNSDLSIQVNLEKIKEVESQVIDLKTRIYRLKEEINEDIEKQGKQLMSKQKKFMEDILGGAQVDFDDLADQWANRTVKPCLRFSYGKQRFVLCQENQKYRLVIESELNELQKQVLYSYLNPLAETQIGKKQQKSVGEFHDQLKQIEEDRQEILSELHTYKKKFLMGKEGDQSVSESILNMYHKELEIKFLEQEDDIAHWTAENLELRDKLKQLSGQNAEQKQRITELNQMVNELLADQGEPEDQEEGNNEQLKEILEKNQELQSRVDQLEQKLEQQSSQKLNFQQEEHKQENDFDDSFLDDIKVVKGTLEGTEPKTEKKRIPVSEREREQEPSFDLENEAKMSANVGGLSEKMKQLELELEHERAKNRNLTAEYQTKSQVKVDQEVEQEIAQIKGTFLPFIRACPITKQQNEMILQAVLKMMKFKKEEIDNIQQQRQQLEYGSNKSDNGGDTEKKKKGLMGMFKGGKKPDSRQGSSTRSVQSPSPIKPLGRR